MISKGAFQGRVAVSNHPFAPAVASNLYGENFIDTDPSHESAYAGDINNVQTYYNQITYAGSLHMLQSLQSIDKSSQITNIVLLNKEFFEASSQLDLRNIQYSAITQYFLPQAFMGNQGSDSSIRDFRSYITENTPHELTIIGYLPEDKANGSNPSVGTEFGGAALLLNGDTNLTATTAPNNEIYNVPGTEVFSIVAFNPISKDPFTPFTIVWNILLDVAPWTVSK